MVEIWKGDELVLRREGKNKGADGTGIYTKFGIYKWVSNPNNPTRVVIHDNLRIGDHTANRAIVDPSRS